MRATGNFVFYLQRSNLCGLPSDPFCGFSISATERGGAIALDFQREASEHIRMLPQRDGFVVRLLHTLKLAIELSGCGRPESVQSGRLVPARSRRSGPQRLPSPSMGLFAVRKIKKTCGGSGFDVLSARGAAPGGVGRVAEWSKAAGCKPAGLSRGGSNPPPPSIQNPRGLGAA